MNLWDTRIREEGGVEELAPKLKAAGFSMADFKDLENRFQPFGSFSQFVPVDIWALLGYVSDAAFSMERLKPYSPSKRIRQIRVVGRASESEHHLYLKQVATEWLKKVKGVKKVVYEAGYEGGVADVSSTDGVWSVECGCTRPSKIWQTFSMESAARKKVVLLSEEGITIFQAGERFMEYVASHQALCLKIATDLQSRAQGF